MRYNVYIDKITGFYYISERNLSNFTILSHKSIMESIEQLINEFKKLGTPKRSQLLSGMINAHTTLLIESRQQYIQQNLINPSLSEFVIPPSQPLENLAPPQSIDNPSPLQSINSHESDIPPLHSPDNNSSDINTTEDGIVIKEKNKYTDKFKEAAVSLARKLNNNNKVARDFNKKYNLKLTETSLREWRKEIDKEEEKKAKKRKQQRDERPKYPEMEKQLYSWFLERRKNKLCVTREDFTKKAKEIVSDSNFVASPGWFKRFRRRNHISIRIPTHIIQKLLAKTNALIQTYLTEFSVFRSETEVLRRTPGKKRILVYNFDETGVQLDMAGKRTYELRGSKEVLIQGTSGSKKRLTFLLGILETGYISPPVVIIQSKYPVPVALRLKYKDEALIYSTPSGWIDEAILKKWFHKVFMTIPFADNVQKVIVFDRCPVHLKDGFKDLQYFLIPPGCTGYLQPLDVAINKPFKDYINKHFKFQAMD